LSGDETLTAVEAVQDLAVKRLVVTARPMNEKEKLEEDQLRH